MHRAQFGLLVEPDAVECKKTFNLKCIELFQLTFGRHFQPYYKPLSLQMSPGGE
jgi:hypothetical protein